jgi:hypothetical protein
MKTFRIGTVAGLLLTLSVASVHAQQAGPSEQSPDCLEWTAVLDEMRSQNLSRASFLHAAAVGASATPLMAKGALKVMPKSVKNQILPRAAAKPVPTTAAVAAQEEASALRRLRGRASKYSLWALPILTFLVGGQFGPHYYDEPTQTVVPNPQSLAELLTAEPAEACRVIATSPALRSEAETFAAGTSPEVRARIVNARQGLVTGGAPEASSRETPALRDTGTSGAEFDTTRAVRVGKVKGS